MSLQELEASIVYLPFLEKTQFALSLINDIQGQVEYQTMLSFDGMLMSRSLDDESNFIDSPYLE